MWLQLWLLIKLVVRKVEIRDYFIDLQSFVKQGWEAVFREGGISWGAFFRGAFFGAACFLEQFREIQNF